jgi:CRP-like cAMP-binding protein
MPHGDDVVDRLGQLVLFADLSRPQHEALAHTYDEEMFGEGQRVLRQGLTGSNLYVILDGEAQVTISGTERARLARGEFFGEVSALLGTPPTADVIAATPLRCLVIPGGEVEQFLVAYPRVAIRMLKTQAERLANTLEWLG